MSDSGFLSVTAGLLTTMSLLGTLEVLVTTAALGYPAYWALKIRKVRATPLYRNQALGLALFSVGIALLSLEADVLGDPLTTPVTAFLFLFVFAMIFFWTDLSAKAARRTDPLFRDTLSWSRVRIVLWAFNLGSIAYIGVSVLASASQPLLFTQDLPYLSLLGFCTVVILSAGILLPVIARRSVDLTLKSHLKWFGGGALFLAIPVLANGFLGDVGIVGLGYCLYRSAKHLAPLNSLDLDLDAIPSGLA